MSEVFLRIIPTDEISSQRRDVFDPGILRRAAVIVEDVRARGERALREYATCFDALDLSAPLILTDAALASARDGISNEERALLTRTAARIRRFAVAQRACVSDLRLEIPGGAAGHSILPVKTAGCYAPGGRYPLVSSMLMTVVTARAAGVEVVWAASPKPSQLMLAAAAIAGADAVLGVGGAHAIAALAYGAGPVPPCDIIVGPGNAWVTAAKHLVSSRTRIDFLAGPSELLILADEFADAALIASDLLAQAEHDVDARPMLVTTHPPLVDAVNHEFVQQLRTLPTRETAEAALMKGFAVPARDMDQAIKLCDRIAPEHLALHVRNADEVAGRVRNYGSLFLGSKSAEVLGDYGAGPNHTLPTGGIARCFSGLSVLNFLRFPTWMRINARDAAAALCGDAESLARLEGLEAHARSASIRDRKAVNP
ncbi:MAG: histidinol dehydrogenase [Planctomycetes bacterium]|nr:histidinol dehydrogenase [Planctomycetota bacterium]MBI3835628.1 histidinol dehydrogenase [Planctomycetota bacterium]